MNFSKQGVLKKQRALNSTSGKWGRKIVLYTIISALIALIAVFICAVALGIGAFKGILANTPKIRLSDVVASGQATIVYDAKGNELDQYVGQSSNRIEVGMDEIPEHLALAFVAIEDERFYQHNGIDFRAIARSGYEFFSSGFKRTQGGSTITQQLLKNTIFLDWTEEGDNYVKKIKRKIQEQYLALEITKNFTKDEVLLRYMNAINLGQNTLGVEAASQRYFGKPCSELTISESAVIACITQNPSGYNPITHPENNQKRRKKCLDKMKELGFITSQEYFTAIGDTENVYKRIGNYNTALKGSTASTGTYFSDAVYAQVKQDLIDAGYTDVLAESLLTAGGLRIESTMDPEIQKIADEEFANPENYPENVKWYLTYALTIYDENEEKHNFSKENMMSWFKEHKDKNFNLIFSSQEDAYEAVNLYREAMLEALKLPIDYENFDEKISMTPQPQAALVIEDQTTGYVVAMVGGRGAKEGRRTLNRATSATRSPGSTFKILSSFAPAMDCAGMTLATVYNDAPFNYNDGTPVRNWYVDSATPYRGIQNIRQGIIQSLNIVAVKNLTVITPQLGFDYLKNFGFTTLESGRMVKGEWKTDIIQAQALGGLTNGVSPYELNAAYAAIANGGIYVEPKLYKRVLDSDGNVILDNTHPATRRVLKETTSYLLTDAMKDVVTEAGGTGKACNFNSNMGIAVKTGTSSRYHDVWIAGYTPYYTCTTWAGYDNNIDMSTSKKNREDYVAKNLWAAIMKRVHEPLPDADFEEPLGIVSMEVCSQSGKLPNIGVCDVAGCVYTELFDEECVPTEQCDVHYVGRICQYDGLPATESCPFAYEGIATLPLVEDEILIPGSTMITTDEFGNQIVTEPATRKYCQHDAEFYLNPDYQVILDNQSWEILMRSIGVPQE